MEPSGLELLVLFGLVAVVVMIVVVIVVVVAAISTLAITSTLISGGLVHATFQELLYFSRIQMKLKLQQKENSGRKSTSLNIKLEKKNSRQKTARAFVPRFPKVKDEAWWLVLGNTATFELYAIKRVSFAADLVTNMELPSDPTAVLEMKLILVSDCYLGFEQEHSIGELVGSN